MSIGNTAVGVLTNPAGELLNIGTSFLHIDLSGGSPRYENGPLVSSVQLRLSQIRAGDPAAIAQSKADEVSGGPGWKDAALVLARYVRPDLLGAPTRALTSEEMQIVGAQPAPPPIGATVAGGAQGAAGSTGGLLSQLAKGLGIDQIGVNAGAAAGSAAGSQVSKGVVEAAIIVAVVVVLVLFFRRR